MATPDAGVVALLRRLRSHICCEPSNEFRHCLPIFERLLSPRKNADVPVQRKLLDVRAKLLSCEQNGNVADVVERMDRVIELFLYMGQQHCKEAATPLNEMIRLLIALAGGDDGDTFVLDDPIQLLTNTKRRVGDGIRMHDIDMVQRSQALFQLAPLKLEENLLYSYNLFSHIGNGISGRHSSLWCPNTNVLHDRGLTETLQSKQPGPFFCLPSSVLVQENSDNMFTTSHTIRSQRHGHASMDVLESFETSRADKQSSGLSPKKNILIFDSSQNVYCAKRTQRKDWEIASSITESSLDKSECSFDFAGPWVARTNAWEDLGDRAGLPESYAKPPARGRNWSLRDLTIPNCFACDGDQVLEINEVDLIGDCLRALNGVDSTIFRKNVQSATFQLPRMCWLKLPLTTVSATKSVLEVFRRSGTIVMRLEQLALFYSQDPSRGGKTLQAMGDALQLYLSAHRTLVETISEECLKFSSCENDQEDGICSVTKLLCKTREVCRVAETIGAIFCCDVADFWLLLQQGKFPRGVALLNRLYHCVSSLRVEDSSGRMQKLVIWFLVKLSSPLLEVLSGLILTGRVYEQRDQFSEFEAATLSENAQMKAATGGGDGLFSDEKSDEVKEMFPIFFGNISSLIAHVVQVQALLRSVNAPASTHNLKPLIMRFREEKATELAEEWKAALNDVVYSEGACHSDAVDSYSKVSGKTSAADKESKRGLLCENTSKVQRRSQLQLKQFLDQQVLEQKKRQLYQIQLEAADDARRINEVDKAIVDHRGHGRMVLIDKYSALMMDAEERHDYMRWRRDRALRLSAAKEQLLRLLDSERTKWVVEEENRSNEPIFDAVEDMVDTFLTKETLQRALGIMTERTAVESASAIEQRARLGEINFAVTSESLFAGKCVRNASHKVNKDLGKCTSTTNFIDHSRGSVKVNGEANNCKAKALSETASADVVSHRTGIRIPNEPGGSGINMYGTLYGETRTEKNAVEAVGASAVPYGDVAMGFRGIDVHNDAMPGVSPLKMFNEKGIESKNTSRNEMKVTNQSTNEGEKLHPDTDEIAGVAAKFVASTRLSLPIVHPFFSTTINEEDFELLTQALSKTALDAKFSSFASIVGCCVESPVRLIAEKLEQAAVDSFRNKLQVLGHLRWLRKFMLMSEGLCMDIFARDFLVGIASSTRVNWGVEGRLSSAFNLAMMEACVTRDAIVQAFYYETTPTLSQLLGSLATIPTISKALNEVTLMYDIKWPLGFVITARSLDCYKLIHRFLLHVRLTSLELREAWATLRLIRKQNQLPLSLDRLCNGTVYEMQTFLWAFNETFVMQALKTAWPDLKLAIRKATKLKDLRRFHEKYILFAFHCCFLDGLASEIHLAFSDLLAASWSLTGFLRTLKRRDAGMACQESRIRALCSKSNVALRELVKKLHNVQRSAERNTRDFTECLLLRLNLSDYYSTNDATGVAD